MPTRPLHLGWLLDMLPGQRVPVHLYAPGLKAHTAIIAQSGSGKSFMLGRLLEEIVSKTRGRVVIFDPNSDFAKFNELNVNVFERFKDEFGASEGEAFRSRWEQFHFRVLSQRHGTMVNGQRNTVVVSPISIAWDGLTFPEKAAFLGFSFQKTPAECEILQAIESNARTSGQSYLADWQKCAAMMSKDRPVALTVSGAMLHLREFGIWDEGDSLRVGMRQVALGYQETKAVCLDLGSLDKHDQQHVASATALNALWTEARKTWLEAMQQDQVADKRCPVFVVVDEAHNLAPAHSISESLQPVTDALVRIAMEGRKYGLFLILVTQRPGNLHPSLMSQCDNLCLMKMNNHADLRLVEESFGFLPPGAAKRALDFKNKGDSLLAGTFVENPVFIHAVPRRTVEGGRNLRDDYWLQDPLPPAAATS